MDYFAGLDISMEETHVCVLDREGAVVHEARTISTAEAIFASLAKAPSCRRVVFETGRMAPMLYHGLRERDVPVVALQLIMRIACQRFQLVSCALNLRTCT
jgi:transposase